MMNSIFFYLFVMSCTFLETWTVKVIDTYPCKGSHKIRERFNISSTPAYMLMIVPSEFEIYPLIYDLKITFDGQADIKRNYVAANFYQDGFTLTEKVIDKSKQGVSMTITPFSGRKMHYFKSLKINHQEVCPIRVHNGIFNEFLLEPPTTPSTTTAFVETTTPLDLPSSRVDTEDRRACGRRGPRPRGLVAGGRAAQQGAWPWHAALYRLNYRAAELAYSCGGTLLSTTRVLTAGHCVMENGAIVVPERLFVALGKYNFYGGDIGLQEKQVFEVVLHPNFVRSTLSNDLSMLKLATEVTLGEFVQPICLWKDDDPTMETREEDGYIAGWGQTDVSKTSIFLMEAVMPIKSDLECIRSNPIFFNKFLTNTTYCAGFANGTSACNGDSGGGMFVPRKDSEGLETWFLRGVVSLSISKAHQHICDPTNFIVFTDAVTQASFIKDHI